MHIHLPFIYINTWHLTFKLKKIYQEFESNFVSCYNLELLDGSQYLVEEDTIRNSNINVSHVFWAMITNWGIFVSDFRNKITCVTKWGIFV
jgi:hypothetical protein